MLNRLWLGFFLTAALAALSRWLIGGDEGVFAAVVGSLFDMADLSVKVMLLLFGTLTLWLGFLNIAEQAGLVDRLARLLGPLFRSPVAWRVLDVLIAVTMFAIAATLVLAQ